MLKHSAGMVVWVHYECAKSVHKVTQVKYLAFLLTVTLGQVRGIFQKNYPSGGGGGEREGEGEGEGGGGN